MKVNIINIGRNVVAGIWGISEHRLLVTGSMEERVHRIVEICPLRSRMLYIQVILQTSLILVDY